MKLDTIETFNTLVNCKVTKEIEILDPLYIYGLELLGEEDGLYIFDVWKLEHGQRDTWKKLDYTFQAYLMEDFGGCIGSAFHEEIGKEAWKIVDSIQVNYKHKGKQHMLGIYMVTT